MKRLLCLLLMLLPVAVKAAGTVNQVPKYTAGTVLGNSSISDDGTTVSSTETASFSGGFEIRSTTTSSQFGNTSAGFHAGDSIIPNDPISGYANTNFGFKAGTSITTGRTNTFLGNTSGVFTDTGFGNTAVGYQSFYEDFDGTFNTAIGHDALVFQDHGDHNTAVGAFALENSGDTASHSDNTGVGYLAGNGISVGNDAIDQCTFLGSGADTTVNGLKNAMALGYNARVATSSTTVIGNSSVVSTILRGTVSIGSGGFAGALSVVGNVTLSSNSVVDAYNASFGAVTAASTSTLTWTEVTDRLGEFVTSSFTATTAGFYEVIVQANASQTAGTGCLLLKVNGTEPAGGESCATGATALATVLPISINRILNLAANDIVRVDGSATSANVTFQKMQLTIKRVP